MMMVGAALAGERPSMQSRNQDIGRRQYKEIGREAMMDSSRITLRKQTRPKLAGHLLLQEREWEISRQK